ncbi:MAG: guanylate kinase [Alphaproteobacteria bacterium]
MNSKLSSSSRRGLMLVISSPSGAGKSTLCRQLLAKDKRISLSVSVTTRAPREGEENGKDYFFISQSEFDKLLSSKKLLEYATVFKNSYGTPREYVEEQLHNGQDVLFDIDWQGATQMRQQMNNDLVSVFILPPSTDVLKKRLEDRDQDDLDVVQYRMSQSAEEMSHWAEYDYVIINDDLNQAQNELDAILAAERLKRERQIGLYEFVSQLGEQAKTYNSKV